MLRALQTRICAIPIVAATTAHSASLSRPADPVVLTGRDLPMFTGTAPGFIGLHGPGTYVGSDTDPMLD